VPFCGHIRINPVSRKELIFKLKALDFEGLFRATNHQYMIKGKQKIFIPNPHGGKDIGIPHPSSLIFYLYAVTNQLTNYST